MKLFVTDEYFADSQKKVRNISMRLEQIRADKNAAYTTDTNTWHDNFAYEHLAREEKQTEKLLAELIVDLDNMQVVQQNTTNHTNTVGLYTQIQVQQLNLNTDEEKQYKITIVPIGATDLNKQIYAYNTPLVNPLIGKSVGDEVIVYLPSGDFQITILSIEPLTVGGTKC